MSKRKIISLVGDNVIAHDVFMSRGIHHIVHVIAAVYKFNDLIANQVSNDRIFSSRAIAR